jgi:hypothetical protein
MKYLAENPRTNIVQLPHATVELGEPADQSALHRREYVAELTPRTETAKDAHSEVVLASYEPETATLDLGTTVRVTSSRMLGVGVQAHVKIQDRHLVAMHPLRRQVHERVEHRAPILGQVPLVNRLFRNVGIAEHEAEVEVPEVSTARIEGEWLYPTDGALIVSLGPVSNHADKTVGERLVVLTAQLVPLDPVPAP